MNNKQPYPSDLTDDEWERIRWLLPRSRRGRTPTHSRRIMLNAVLYVARTGCQWRQLPHEFPPWSAVYAFFRRLGQAGVWEAINASLRRQVRVQAGRDPEPSLLIIDSQSVQTAEKRGSAALIVTSRPKASNATWPSRPTVG